VQLFACQNCGARLYFEIRRGAEALDPADWLRLAPEL